MKTLHGLTALLSLAAGARAQNWFEIYPEDQVLGVPYTGVPTRLSIPPTGAGEILMEVADRPGNSFFRGVGGYCGTCCIDAVRVNLTDSFPATANRFRVVIRANLATGGPNPIGLPLFVSPVITTTVGAGPCTLYTVPIPPLAIPCVGGFSIGVSLAAETVADHLKVCCAYYSPVLLAATGDFPKNPGVPSYAWDIQAAVATNSLAPRMALRLAARTCLLPGQSPVLNMGNNHPAPGRLAAVAVSYGVGGMWPSAVVAPPAPRVPLTGDGLNARVTHAPHFGGFAVLFVSTSVFPVPAVIPPCLMLWVNPDLVINLGALNGVGTIRAPILPPGANGWLLGKSLWFQAATIKGASISLSNAQKVQW